MIEMPRYLVTSALPYANGPLHLGHLAGAYLPADIYVRFLRMAGEDVVYVCGTDEHGVPITITAERMGMSPRDVVDRYHKVICEDFRRFGISFDNFSRTEMPAHYELAQSVFLDLLSKGHIVERPMSQYHCPSCSRFLPDRYVLGTCPRCESEGARGDQCEDCGSWLDARDLVSPACALCGGAPEPRETSHWFLRLDAFQEWLEGWLGSREGWKSNVLNYCRGWLDEGLRERAITRDLDWGVPVPLPEAEGKVLYVWFEALLGYVSSTRELFEERGEPSGWERYWKDPETRLVHFIGKDNIVFHAVIEPVILQALGGYVLPWNVPANEYLNISGAKFSTSRGTAIWMGDYLQHLDPDPMRYALAVNAPENRDTDFSWDDFRVRNNELADVFGNFVNRTVKFTHRFFDGSVPDPGERGGEGAALLERGGEVRDGMEKLIRSFRLKAACAEAMDLARAGNRFFDSAQPWKTAESDPQECARTLYYCLQLADTLRILLSPYVPFTCERTAKMLGREEVPWSEAGRCNLEPGSELGEPEILLAKLKKGFEKVFLPEEPEPEREPEAGSGEAGETGGAVSIDEFMKVELRVGRVLTAEAVSGADRLYLISVDMGDHRRQIVAGIRPWYPDPAALEGRKVVVVANLEPATIRGVESRGMLLASDGGEGVFLVSPDESAAPGDRVR